MSSLRMLVPALLILLAVVLSACSDFSTSVEPRYCNESEQAPLLGHPYHQWPDRYGVRLYSHVEAEPVATDLAERFGLELGFVSPRGFYATIPESVIPILQCDPRIRDIHWLGPPITIPR